LSAQVQREVVLPLHVRFAHLPSVVLLAIHFEAFTLFNHGLYPAKKSKDLQRFFIRSLKHL